MQGLDISTLISIAIAVGILLYLRSILGQRTGHDKPDEFYDRMTKDKSQEKEQAPADNVVKLPTREKAQGGEMKNPAMAAIDKMAEPGSDLNSQLKQLVASDSSFDPKEFLGGANMAYEMIINAFADGDKKSLRNLLSREVFEGFESVIDERVKNGDKVKSSFIGIDHSEIKSVEMKGTEANLTLRFESQIISATYDKDDKLIEGDDNEVVRVKDIWTFARDTRSRDPNWKLVATEAEE